MNNEDEEWNEEQDEHQYNAAKPKLGNNLTIWGNSRTMNLNHLVLTNIQNSPYFKVRLFELKTYHEVVDEIYYKVRFQVDEQEWLALFFGQTTFAIWHMLQKRDSKLKGTL